MLVIKGLGIIFFGAWQLLVSLGAGSFWCQFCSTILASGNVEMLLTLTSPHVKFQVGPM